MTAIVLNWFPFEEELTTKNLHLHTHQRTQMILRHKSRATCNDDTVFRERSDRMGRERGKRYIYNGLTTVCPRCSEAKEQVYGLILFFKARTYVYITILENRANFKHVI